MNDEYFTSRRFSYLVRTPDGDCYATSPDATMYGTRMKAVELAQRLNLGEDAIIDIRIYMDLLTKDMRYYDAAWKSEQKDKAKRARDIEKAKNPPVKKAKKPVKKKGGLKKDGTPRKNANPTKLALELGK